jgi:hypothetical protein
VFQGLPHLHKQRLDDIPENIREAEVAALLLDSGLLSSQKEMFSRKTTQPTYTSSGLMTSPKTSVRRKSRPYFLTVGF